MPTAEVSILAPSKSTLWPEVSILPPLPALMPPLARAVPWKASEPDVMSAMALTVPPLPVAAVAEASSVASDATLICPPVIEIVPPLPAESPAFSVLPDTATVPPAPAVK